MTEDGRLSSQAKIAGTTAVVLDKSFSGNLTIRIGSEGIPESLTDYITIPK